MHIRSRNTVRKLPLVVAMMGCLYGTGVVAQEAPAQESQEQSKKDEAKTLEKITVTGDLRRIV